MIPQPHFASFWAGPRLSPYEAACFGSFVRHGCAMTVYSFDPVENLPDGVAAGNAAAVVDRRFLDAFLVKGKPSVAHFSDLFRVRLFAVTSEIWVDSDMLLLRPFDAALPATVLAREDDDTLCLAIMRLDGADPALARLIEATEALAGQTLAWAATGPKLMLDCFGPNLARQAAGPAEFFPVHYDDFWKPFLPEFREECEASCAGAHTLHLWNNILTKAGIWKELMPPAGSFLGERFRADGMAPLFVGSYPPGPMSMMMDNYRMRLSGSPKDAVRFARLVWPGVKRRLERRAPLRWALARAAPAEREA